MAFLYIRHATALTPAGWLYNAAVLIEGGRIAMVAPEAQLPPPPTAAVLDATGMSLVPGFIDLQVNGGYGLDFTQRPASIWEVAARLPETGVTAFLPTIITAPPETVARAQAAVARPPGGWRGATPLGLHLEGPFLNPAKKGAHNPAFFRPPTIEAVTGWLPERGVRLVTLAPELPGALDVVRQLVGRGVVVAAGHSLATYEEARAALDAGIRYGTHLFNAMPPLGHREPGLAGALLADERAVIGLIPDGVHIHPAVMQLLWRAAGGRVNLVTDAMAAMGMAPGRYALGDQMVTVDGTTARLADGTLAGSVVTLDEGLRRFMTATGCPLTEAVAAVTTVPVGVLGLAERKGQIAPGFDADLVLLAAGGAVAATIVAGEMVYSRPVG